MSFLCILGNRQNLASVGFFMIKYSKFFSVRLRDLILISSSVTFSDIFLLCHCLFLIEFVILQLSIAFPEIIYGVHYYHS